MINSPEITFALTIEGQDMQVRFRPNYLAEYGQFQFLSPHIPARRIPVSETGYLSQFVPMWQINEAPDVEVYARALALALMNRKRGPDEDDDDANQLALF